jgi:hypothetical protein
MLKIALDLDNCILDSTSTIFNLHNKLNKNKIIYDKNIDLQWDFKPLINTKEELAELFKLFDNQMFYNDENLVVYENAIKVINELSMQNYIVIISKHQKSRKPLTRKWIYETFPTVDLVFVDDFSDKGNILKGFDVILDDRIDALDSCNEVKYRICYGNYSWNSEWTGLRVTNWLEFRELIHKINNKEREGIKK